MYTGTYLGTFVHLYTGFKHYNVISCGDILGESEARHSTEHNFHLRSVAELYESRQSQHQARDQVPKTAGGI